jgi:apolipoprotein N-acyltransferase
MAERAAGLLLRAAGPLAPAQRAALWLAGLYGWRRHLAAFLLGVLAATALPPFYVTSVLIISFTGLVWLNDGSLDGRGAFALGWSFGFGFFLAGLYWIGAALFVDIAQFWWLLPFAVLGIPAGLALFTAAALWASYWACRRWHIAGTGRILVLAVAWCVAEWLRGHIFTGFPWNLVGYAWSGPSFPGALAMLQTTAVIGIYGLSLLTVLAAALPARLGDLSGRRWRAVLWAVLLIGVPAAAGAARLAFGPAMTVPGVNLRLVQPSIPEELKNDPAARAANFRRLLALSASPGADKATAIIWPEAAAPPFLARDAAARRAIATIAPPHGLVIVGTVRSDPPPGPARHIWNSLEAIDRTGAIVGSYDKFHLVPFGEYVPLRGLLPINKITPGTVDFSAGTGPRTLDLPGLPAVGPLICYEAIFPGEVVDPTHRPDWLLNITNDAWYGFTSGPFQHLAIARVRAVEEGLPLVRDGNNGISAVIDPYGRVLARLDLNAVSVLDAPLPRPLPPTPYSRAKDAFFLGLILLLIAATVLVSRNSTNHPHDV